SITENAAEKTSGTKGTGQTGCSLHEFLLPRHELVGPVHGFDQFLGSRTIFQVLRRPAVLEVLQAVVNRLDRHAIYRQSEIEDAYAMRRQKSRRAGVVGRSAEQEE